MLVSEVRKAEDSLHSIIRVEILNNAIFDNCTKSRIFFPHVLTGEDKMKGQKMQTSLSYSKEQWRVIQRSHVSDILQGTASNDVGNTALTPKIQQYVGSLDCKLWVIDERF